MSVLIETIVLLLLGIILAIEWIVRLCLTTFYRYFPFPSFLDTIYFDTAFLRAAFSRGFAGPDTIPEFKYDFHQFLSKYGYQVEDHYVETPDGFCLTLHRIVPKYSKNLSHQSLFQSTTQSIPDRLDYPTEKNDEHNSIYFEFNRSLPSDGGFPGMSTIGLSQERYHMSSLLSLPEPLTQTGSCRSRYVAHKNSYTGCFNETGVCLPHQSTESVPLLYDLCHVPTNNVMKQFNHTTILEPQHPVVSELQTSGYTTEHQLTTNTSRYPVLLIHGLMMSSEVFVIDQELSIPICLANAGYDVWVGNNRGNRYSWMHRYYKRTDNRYWDFSIDELARFDIPAFIKYITRISGSPSLSYIGFSNGSAQMFAALSTNPGLNSILDAFIALSPACKLQSLNPEAEKFSLLYPLLTSNRHVFISIFGKKAMLSLTTQWKNILSTRFFTMLINYALWCLFTWHPKNVDSKIRDLFYSHIYSTTSTKVVHHWFQMLRSGRFEFYNDTAGDEASETVFIPQYNVEKITTPVALICGAQDRLSDIRWLQSQLGNCESWDIPHYEHLDCLISRDVPQLVFPIILDILQKRKKIYNRQTFLANDRLQQQFPNYIETLRDKQSKYVTDVSIQTDDPINVRVPVFQDELDPSCAYIYEKQIMTNSPIHNEITILNKEIFLKEIGVHAASIPDEQYIIPDNPIHHTFLHSECSPPQQQQTLETNISLNFKEETEKKITI